LITTVRAFLKLKWLYLSQNRQFFVILANISKVYNKSDRKLLFCFPSRCSPNLRRA
jgi:hypothetical protein